MPLKLIPPGTRKDNKFYLILGMEAGTQYEVSTRTADKKLAQVRLDELRAKIDGAPRAGSRITFAQATDLYLSYRSPGTREARALQRVQPVLGRKLVHEIRQADLVHAANLLYGEQTAATRNRAVMRPAGAVLHYASRNGYCPWLRIEQFKEPKPTTRAVARETADQLIAATDGAKRLLLTWLFWQGTRISDTLRVRWGEIDLEEATVKIRTHKTGKDHLFPLDEAVVALLRDVPEHRREGPVFPWSHRNSVGSPLSSPGLA